MRKRGKVLELVVVILLIISFFFTLLSLDTSLEPSEGQKITGLVSTRQGSNDLLYTWHEPYENITPGRHIMIFANFTAQNESIKDAECLLNFSNKSETMVYDLGLHFFPYYFNYSGNYSYNITCNATGYDTLQTTDYVLVINKTINKTINESLVNDSMINQSENVSIEQNQTELNISINETQINISINQTDENVTAEINETINETSNISFDKNETEDLIINQTESNISSNVSIEQNQTENIIANLTETNITGAAIVEEAIKKINESETENETKTERNEKVSEILSVQYKTQLEEKLKQKDSKIKLSKIQRIDEKNYELEIKQDNKNKINIKTKNPNAVNGIKFKNKILPIIIDGKFRFLRTDIISVDDNESIESAEITLEKGREVNKVAYCENYDLDKNKCNSDWQKTGINLFQDEETITFTAKHFSAYAGFYDPDYDSQTLFIDNITISPENPYADDDLNCIYSSKTAGITTIDYRWFINGAMVYYDNQTLPNTVTNINDEVYCEMIPYNNSLIASYHFHEYSLNDNSSNGHTIEKSSNLPTNNSDGKWGECFEFNDTNDEYLRTPSDSIFDVTTANFTVTLWGYMNDTAGGNGRIISNPDGDPGGNGKVLCTAATNGMNCYVKNDTNSAKSANVNTGSSVLGEWHFYAITWNGTTLCTYVDDTKVCDGWSFPMALQSENANRWYFSAFSSSYSQNINGKLDEIKIFNKALSEEEINEIYNSNTTFTSKSKLTIDEALSTGSATSALEESNGNLSLKMEGLDYPTEASAVLFLNNDLSDDVGTYTWSNNSQQFSFVDAGYHSEGGQILYDGNSNYVRSAEYKNWDVNESETRCLWYKHNDEDCTYTSVNVVGLISQYDGTYRTLRFYNTGGSCQVEWVLGSTIRYDFDDTTMDEWNFICAVYNETDNHNSSIYWNGNRVSSLADVTASGTNQRYYIGTSVAFGTNTMNGSFDDVMIWEGKALTETKIEELYNGTRDKYYSTGNYTSEVYDLGDETTDITAFDFRAGDNTYHNYINQSWNFEGTFDDSGHWIVSDAGTERIQSSECFEGDYCARLIRNDTDTSPTIWFRWNKNPRIEVNSSTTYKFEMAEKYTSQDSSGKIYYKVNMQCYDSGGSQTQTGTFWTINTGTEQPNWAVNTGTFTTDSDVTECQAGVTVLNNNATVYVDTWRLYESEKPHIKFKVRTSADNSTWQDWSPYFFERKINPYNITDQRYAQWKAFFVSDGTGTPELDYALFEHEDYYSEIIPYIIDDCMEINKSGIYEISNDISSNRNNACINITVDDVEINCVGNYVDGDETGYAIYADNQNNITLNDCILRDWDYGVYFVNISDSYIYNLTGIRSSRNSYLTNSNNVTLDGESEGSLSDDFGQGYGLYLENSTNCSIINHVLSMGIGGKEIYLSNSNYTTIYNNNLIQSESFHIQLYSSNQNNITDNYVKSGYKSIYLSSSSNNDIINNDVYANLGEGGAAGGIFLNSSSDNTIKLNNISNNTGGGLYLTTNSHRNIITNNTFNQSENLEIASGLNNSIYWNDFYKGDSHHITTSTTGNYYNTTMGGSAQGNYYDDILDYYVYDVDADGFGDAGTDYPVNNSYTKIGGISNGVIDYGPETTKSNMLNSCENLSYSGGTFTMDASITDAEAAICMNFLTSNVTLDCSGYTIDGIDSNIGAGSSVGSPTDINIKNCIINDWGTGARFSYNNWTLDNCTFTSNANSAIHADSITGFYLNNSNISNNECSGDGTLFLEAVSGKIEETYFSNNLLGPMGGSVHDFNVTNCELRNEHQGVVFEDAYNVIFDNNTFYNVTGDGLYIADEGSGGNIFRNNNLTKTIIQMTGWTDGSVYNNVVEDASEGIELVGTLSNVDIYNNTLTNNTYGIKDRVISSVTNSDLQIFNNTITECDIGINLTDYNNLTIYNNNLSNTINTYDTGTNNWNTSQQSGPNIIGGSNIGGNYYSDYTGTDITGDGIGSTTYSINGGSMIDYLPLTNDEWPSAPSLYIPADETGNVIDRTPEMLWNNSNSLYNPVTYQIQVDDNSDFSSPEINIVGITETTTNTSYTPVADLDVDTTYYWRVRGNSSQGGYGPYAEPFQYTILSSVAVSMPVSLVEFNEIEPENSNDTSDDSPLPLIIANDGNVDSNITINAEPLWEADSAADDFYQFKIRENESSSYVSATETWTNLNMTLQSAIINLHYPDSTDSAKIDLKVTVADDEPPGSKESQINITATYE